MSKKTVIEPFLLNAVQLPDALVLTLRRFNPWWEGKPAKELPPIRRNFVSLLKKRLENRIAPIIVVRGPRQVGKTTAQEQVVDDLLVSGVEPERIFRVQFDELPELNRLKEPILSLVDWFERNVLKKSLNEAHREKKEAYLFLDEVQNLDSWAPQLKTLVDHSDVRVIVTGSSALRIEKGRDSLAGRINTIETGVLTITEIAKFHAISVGEPELLDNGVESLLAKDFWLKLTERGRESRKSLDEAFRLFSKFGGYPLTHQNRDIGWPQLSDQLNETVVRRVIQHDLRLGEKGRKRDSRLLEEVFRLCCRYAGQTPSVKLFVDECQKTLDANVGQQRVTSYLRFLADALLIRLVEPLEIRLKRKKGYAKICLADHALRASWLQEQISLVPEEMEKNQVDAAMAGHIAESVVGNALGSISGLDLCHLPGRKDQEEIDFIVTVGDTRIPLEVKYRKNIENADLLALRRFLDKKINKASFGIVVTQKQEQTNDDRIVAVPLSNLLLLR